MTSDFCMFVIVFVDLFSFTLKYFVVEELTNAANLYSLSKDKRQMFEVFLVSSYDRVNIILTTGCKTLSNSSYIPVSYPALSWSEKSLDDDYRT